jgi:Uma2 family endonuclease
MTSLLTPPATIRTLADLLERLGGISADRVRFHPAPGTATEADVLEVERRENRLCELVDGVLVEKAMGFRESLLAFALGGILRAFVVPRNLGLVSGPDGTLRLFPGLVRIPDVAFISWDRIPDRRVPEAPIPGLAPDLAVEVLSPSNTTAEMARKRGEYFAAGVRLVWSVDPRSRTVTVHDAEGRSTTLDEAATLDGGAVLPGFAMPLKDLFAELDRRGGE